MALLLPGAAAAQDGGPVYSADEIARILRTGGAGPSAGGGGGGAGGGAGVGTYSAGELAAILSPVRSTRALTAGQGPKPGAPGSGVVPDIRVHFGFNSTEILPSAQAQLDELGRAMQFDELQSLRFVIGGHTDAVGPASVNERLSQRRAEAVVSYLSEGFQIERDRLDAVGFGERELLDPANPASGENRRVEVRTQR
jgi:outer membrane protein OmpA-like peptidoglycan-associated protein